MAIPVYLFTRVIEEKNKIGFRFKRSDGGVI